MEHPETLARKIDSGEASATVIGLGHVGLPTSIMFAIAGYQTCGVDLDLNLIKRLAKREGLAEYERTLLKNLDDAGAKHSLEFATDTPHAVATADLIVVAVPTPVDKTGRYDSSHVDSVIGSIASHSRGKLVVIASTLGIGHMEGAIIPALGKKGIKPGSDFWLAYCPERLVPDAPLQEMRKNPRVVAANDDQSKDLASRLYSRVFGVKLATTDFRTAEIAKLVENAYRDVGIAFANEVARICDAFGASATEAISLANTHPRVSVLQPGCGVGGTCIPKDPMILLSNLREKGTKLELIPAARLVNESMPMYTTRLLDEALLSTRKPGPAGRIVGLLGLAYKGETTTTEGSPAISIAEILLDRGFQVRGYDPYASHSGIARCGTPQELFKGCDAVIVCTDHKAFASLPLQSLLQTMNPPPIMIDGRNIFRSLAASLEGVYYRGIGNPRIT